MSQPEQFAATGHATRANWDHIPVEQLSPLIGRQFVVGTNVTVARVLVKQGAVVPLHHHFNEQITAVLEGALTFLMEGTEISVRPGEVLCIPQEVPPEVHALEDTVTLDIFNPPRQDWIDGDDAYVRQQR